MTPTPTTPEQAPHPYVPSVITAWTAARPEQPLCRVCSRFEDDAIHREAERRLAEAIDAER